MICWCDEPFIDGLGYHCRGCDKHNSIHNERCATCGMKRELAWQRGPLLVAEVADVLRHPAENAQVLVAGLVDAVVVVPDADVGVVEVGNGRDVAGFNGGEEALGGLER